MVSPGVRLYYTAQITDTWVESPTCAMQYESLEDARFIAACHPACPSYGEYDVVLANWYSNKLGENRLKEEMITIPYSRRYRRF